MKIKVFQSDKGDCLLLDDGDGKLVLVDGGMSGSYRKHVAPALGKLQKAGRKLDAVCVSHIDQDHIAGILRMADDLVAWRIYDYQERTGNTRVRKPRFPRPPEIDRVWHNAFHEQVGKNAGPIEDMLAARARALSVSTQKFARDAAERFVEIAHSKGEAVRLSRRLGRRQLNVPLNPEYGRHLMYVADPPDSIKLGNLDFTVIGPFDEDLRKLRTEWNKWLETQKAKDQLARIRRKHEEDEDRLHAGRRDDALAALRAQAAELGNRDSVTLPNLASLMLYVRGKNDATLLLTGDGHWQDILDGLEAAGKLDAGQGMHVNVLKVQHHGSEHNWHVDFGKRITADHYVFCGNGAHHNPDLGVVDALLDSRVGPASRRSSNPQASQPFKVWFNCASSVAPEKYRDHMRDLERKLKSVTRRHSRVESFFLTGSSFELKV